MPWTKCLQIDSVSRQQPSQQQTQPQRASSQSVPLVVNSIVNNLLWDIHRDTTLFEIVSSLPGRELVHLITAIEHQVDPILISVLVIKAIRYNNITKRHKLNLRNEFIQEYNQSGDPRDRGNNLFDRLFKHSSRIIYSQ